MMKMPKPVSPFRRVRPCATRPTTQPTRQRRPAALELRRVAGDVFCAASSTIMPDRHHHMPRGVSPFAMMSGDETRTRPDVAMAELVTDAARTADATTFADLGPHDVAAAAMLDDSATQAAVQWHQRAAEIAAMPAAVQARAIDTLVHELVPTAHRLLDSELTAVITFFRGAIHESPLPGNFLTTLFRAVLQHLAGQRMSSGLPAPWYCLAELLPSEHTTDAALELTFLADIFRALTAQREDLLAELFPYLHTHHPDRVRAFSYLFMFADAGDGSAVTAMPFTSVEAMVEFESHVTTRSRHEALAQLRNYEIYLAQPKRLKRACAVVAEQHLPDAIPLLEIILHDGRFDNIHRLVRNTLQALHKKTTDVLTKQRALIPLWTDALRAGRKREAKKLSARIDTLIALYQQQKAAAVVATTSRFELPTDVAALDLRIPELTGKISADDYYAAVRDLARQVAPDVDMRLVRGRTLVNHGVDEFSQSSYVTIDDIDRLMTLDMTHPEYHAMILQVAREIFWAHNIVLPDGSKISSTNGFPVTKKWPLKKMMLENVVTFEKIERLIRTGNYKPTAPPEKNFGVDYTLEVHVPSADPAQTQQLQRLVGAMHRLHYRDPAAYLAVNIPLHCCVADTVDASAAQKLLAQINPTRIGNVTISHKTAIGMRTVLAASENTSAPQRLDLTISATTDASWQQHLVNAVFDNAALAHHAQRSNYLPLVLGIALPDGAAVTTALRPLLESLATHFALQPESLPLLPKAGWWTTVGGFATAMTDAALHGPQWLASAGACAVVGGAVACLTGILSADSHYKKYQHHLTVMLNDTPLFTAQRDSNDNTPVAVEFHATHPHAAALCALWNSITGAPRAIVARVDESQ